MGYYVNIQESTFQIPAENLSEAYERMCKLNFTVPNSQKSGGSWPGKDKAPQYGPFESAWFSWMPWNYHEEYKTAEEILEALGFDTYTEGDGSLHICGYDSKTGQENLFLESVCNLAKGYIVWQGEQGELWGETYGGDEVIVKERGKDYSDIVTV